MLTEQTRIGIPDRFEIDNAAGAFRIRWKWSKLVAIPLLFFSVAWDGFLLAWYMGAVSRGNASLIELVFPIGHVAAGLAILYVAIAFLANTTTVAVASGQITVSHQPVPWPGSRTLHTTEIRQLFCCERRGSKGSRSYDVMARLTSDREVKLLSGLSDEREARFLEQRIEERLGLPNMAVAGELRR
jgi:hypothetical protein